MGDAAFGRAFEEGSALRFDNAVGLALGLAVLLGVWNGVLVAVGGIQPIIATLVLMVAGRGVAQLITDGQIITINSAPYKLIGGGYWLTLPFCLIVAAVITALAADRLPAASLDRTVNVWVVAGARPESWNVGVAVAPTDVPSARSTS